MSFLTVLVAIGIIVYVIGQQLLGSSLRGKRLVVLPAVLTVIGIVDISGQKSHLAATDIVLLVVSAAIAIATGAGLGALTRLQRRDGYLWAQLPKRGLWLWGGLIVSRLVIIGIAHAAGADVAAGTAAILLMLALNRGAQALVVVSRAIAAGIPFAPEKDGTVFGASWFSRSTGREA
ncbi:MAG TPA: hypothetical protein VN892_12065 [Solirubrobacteraceae bacterium]|nr:hypothetical protein [Solirubrobacteraceae bacterium]